MTLEWATRDRESTQEPGVRICPDHEGEKMHYFCVTCNMLACQACLILNYKNDKHEIEGLKKRYNDQKIQMNALKVKTGHIIELADDRLRNLQNVKSRIKDSHQEVEEQIDNFIATHVNALLDKGQELKKLQEAEQMKLADLNKHLQDVIKKVESAKTNHQTVVNTLENTPNHEYINQHSSLVDKINNIDLTEELGFTPHAAADFIPEQKHIVNLSVGHIRLVTPGKQRKLELIQILDGFVVANKISYSTNNLLAVCDLFGKKVIVYHQVNRKYEEKLILNLTPDNDGNLHDVSIGPDGKFMVARGSCNEVYSHEGNYQNSIQTGGRNAQRDVRRVKISSSSRILTGDYGNSLITEHDPTGNVYEH